MAVEKRGKITITADVRTAYDAITRLGTAFDSALKSGYEFNNLAKNLPFALDKAARATAGLVSNLDLAKAASRQAALGLNFTSEQFSSLAKAAVIAGQAMGMDAGTAINDLMTGMARMSPKILDNLGIVVQAQSAYDAYAAKLGTTANRLTEAAKRVAFMEAAMKELNRIAGRGTIETNNLGGAWAKAKVEVSNLATATKAWFAGLDVKHLSRFRDNVGHLTAAFQILRGQLDLTNKAQLRLTSSYLYWLNLTRGAAATKAVADYAVKLHALQSFVAGINAKQEEGVALGADDFFNRMQAKHGVGEALIKPGRRKARKRPDLWLVEGAADAQQMGTEKARDRRRREREFGRKGRFQEWDEKRQAQNAADEARDRAASDRGKAMRAEYEAQQKLNAALKEQVELMGTIGLSALSNFTAGIWDAAAAAAAGEVSFGRAMAGMLKSTLLGIAKESTVQAIKQLALAFGAYPDVAGMTTHFKSAALWGAAGIAAGAAGIGVSAAMGGSGKSAGGGSAAGNSYTSRPSSRGGNAGRPDSRPIVINIRYDKGDPSSVLLARKKIAAELKAA